MASYFVDSSALAKFYHPEIGTEVMDRIFGTMNSEIYVSRLTLVEIPSVLAIKVRTGFIRLEDATTALRRFHEDVLTRRFSVFAIREWEFTLAEILIEKYAFTLRLRALDAVQLAVALRVKSGLSIDYFVASDKILCEVAEREGFSVRNPEIA